MAEIKIGRRPVRTRRLFPRVHADRDARPADAFPGRLRHDDALEREGAAVNGAVFLPALELCVAADR